MTLRPLAHDFAMMAPPIARDGLPGLRLSIRPPHAVPSDEGRLEVMAEVERRRAAYPRWVANKRVTQTEADHHLALLARIAADLDEPHPDLAGQALGRWHKDHLAARAAAPFRWSDKVRELRRELALRRNVYPKAIAAHRMTETEARDRMERMEAVHWRYWIQLEQWDEASRDEPIHAAIRARAAAVDAWCIDAHRRADPAIAGYLSPAMLAWLDHTYPPRERAA